MPHADDTPGRPLMSQRWADNSFLHWRVPAETVRRHLPHTLHLDTYGGEAWLSLVALRVRQARAAGLPRFLGVSYAQVNLRTYVSCGGRPGLFFLGIHFSRALLAAGASVAFGVPSRRARLRFAHVENEVTVQVDPPRDGSGGVFTRLRVEPEARTPLEGDLDHWLHERYSFYSVRGRNLLRTDVSHDPWVLRTARVEVIEGALGGALERVRVPDHATFAEVKDVTLQPPERIARLPRAELAAVATSASL